MGEGEHDEIVAKYAEALKLAGDFERTHFRAARARLLIAALERESVQLALLPELTPLCLRPLVARPAMVLL